MAQEKEGAQPRTVTCASTGYEPKDLRPEIRRLKAVPEGGETAGVRCDGTVQGPAAAANPGDLRGGAGHGALTDVPRPVHLPLDFGVARDPEGLLAPMVRNLTLGPRDGDGRDLHYAGQGQVQRSGQVRAGDHGGRLPGSDVVRSGRSTVEVNPFWSAGVRREAEMGQDGRHQGVAPARSLQPAMDAAGTGQVDPDEAEMERIRRRILLEAEEAFKMEIRKLRGDGVGTDSRSYHSASSGGDQACSQGAQGGRPGVGTAGTPGGGDRIGMASMSTPAPGDRGGAGQGATPGHGPAGMATPPGLDGRLHGGGFLGAPQNGVQDSLKSHELPPLPVPGADGASLAFGDWMALAGPQMGDIGLNSRDWWLYVRHQVELLYERWLVSTPVERLRLRPVEGDIPGEFQRVEQRGVSMLLAAAPEPVKRDLVATRTLSSTGILFRFYTVYQPGGGSEKAALLRQITEPKIGSSVADLLTGLRSWRRLLGRANELRLALPDPVVLSGILGRMADALGRAGGG
eukprot:s102_g3.t1